MNNALSLEFFAAATRDSRPRFLALPATVPRFLAVWQLSAIFPILHEIIICSHYFEPNIAKIVHPCLDRKT